MSKDKDCKIGIVVGSRTDFKFFTPILEQMQEWGVGYEFTIASAHRTPDRLTQWLERMEKEGIEVIIAGAGGAAHLPGVVASQTLLPVIGVPLDTTHLRGVDALYSIVQMPSGIPVATVGINNTKNALTLAMLILGIKHDTYRKMMIKFRKDMANKVEGQMADLIADYADLLQGIDHEARAPNQKESTPKMSAHKLHKDKDSKDLRNLEEEFKKFSEKMEEKRSTGGEKPQRRRRKEYVEISEPEMQAPEREKQEKGERGIQGQQNRKKARIFRVDPQNPEPEIIEEASIALLDGGIIAFPTDTVYGIGVDATNATAVGRLYKIKERSEQKPIPVLIHSLQSLRSLAKEIPDTLFPVIEKFWPGSLTIVFRKYRNTFRALGHEETIGIRIPDNMVCLSLLSMTARPIATTSANPSGQPPATTAEQVMNYFGSAIDVILDSGSTGTGEVSTVLSVADEPFTILREGKITRLMLQEILGKTLKD